MKPFTQLVKNMEVKETLWIEHTDAGYLENLRIRVRAYIYRLKKKNIKKTLRCILVGNLLCVVRMR